MPTYPVLAVIFEEILSLAFKITVKGPGQKISVIYRNNSFVGRSISTNVRACSYDVTCTITGSDKGRPIFR